MMNTLTAEQVRTHAERNSDLLLINTLDANDFASTQIPGSINIPQSQDDFVKRVEGEAGHRDREIVVYCASEKCNSSTQAAQKLQDAGFTNVYDFEAGAQGWKQAGKQLVES